MQFDALELQEKLFSPPFSLLSKFTREMRQTWIPVIISILRRYNHVVLIGIHNINALDLVEKLFFPPFSF